MNLHWCSLILWTSNLCFYPVQSFTFYSNARSSSWSFLSTSTSLDSVASATKSIADIKTEIETEIQSTSRGLSASTDKRAKIDSLVSELESKCPLNAPARSPMMGGKWIVDYTTAPPPSNGKLGPFVGIARQIIDLDQKTYTNYLSVPGDIEKEWLSARLEATFVEWNGELLEDDRNLNSGVKDTNQETEVKYIEPVKEEDNWLEGITSFFQRKEDVKGGKASTPDYGADSWKVDFKSLTIKVFGFQLIRKEFDEGTSRVWKMSYLDDSGTRIGK